MLDETARLADLVKDGVIEIGAGRPRSAGADFPVLRVADVLDGRIQVACEAHGMAKARRSLSPKVSRAGDIVLTTKGTVGRVAIMPDDGSTFAYSPQICYFRPLAQDMLVFRYFYYWLRSPGFLTQALPLKSQTDMADFISLQDLYSVRVQLPPVGEQQAIAEVLGALDDKIAANAELVATCDALLVASYERALRDTSRTLPLNNVAQFHNRRRVPLSAQQREQRPGTVPYYGATGVFGHVDEAIFDERLVLVGEDGSVVQPDGRPVVQYVWGPSWVNNHAHVLTGVGISTEVLRLAVARSNVAPIVTGAVQPKISMRNLKSLVLDVPSSEALSELEARVKELCDLTRARTEESRTLTKLRDTLLPPLMSGRLTVKDAERVVEGVV